MRNVLALAGWDPLLSRQALAVACGIGNPVWPNGESGCHPGSVNGPYRGLFQIGVEWAAHYHFDPDLLFDPVFNAQVARWLVEYDLSQGWSPWALWSVKPP